MKALKLQKRSYTLMVSKLKTLVYPKLNDVVEILSTNYNFIKKN